MRALSGFKSQGRIALLLALGALLVMVALVEHIYRIESSRVSDRLARDVLQQAGSMRARLERELNSTLFLATGLVGYVTAYDDLLEPERVQTALRVIYRQGQHISHVALAPDNVIAHIHPREGNERAIGLDYRTNPEQWPRVRQAMREGTTVLAGPLNLVQGGRGLISRTPVFLENGDYWGLLSLVLDSDALFGSIGIGGSEDGVAYALRWRETEPHPETHIAGNPEWFAADPVLLDIPVPGGQWELAAAPVDGWQAPAPHLSYYRAGGLLLSLLIAALVFAVFRERQHIARMALHDQLTRLPNRRYLSRELEEQLRRCDRRQDKLALLYIDLDGFKAVNDRFGHRQGDVVLVSLAERMRSACSADDFLARIGGDEFCLLQPGVASHQEARERASALLETVREPLDESVDAMVLDATLGVAIYPDDGSDAVELLQAADQNMYLGKPARLSSVAT